MIVLGPTLETDRLILRPPMAEDFDAWAALLADPVATQFIGGIQPPSGAWRSLATMIGAWVLNGAANFSVIEKASGRWVGRAGPWQPHGWPGPEIAWAFDRSVWGRGYASEAARSCVDFAFDTLGWDRVVHVIAPANAASVAVALRIGSTLLGPTRLPPPFDAVAAELYGQSRSAMTV
jgi:RimJ/RimL family protein N-acetyltransferase